MSLHDEIIRASRFARDPRVGGLLATFGLARRLPFGIAWVAFHGLTYEPVEDGGDACLIVPVFEDDDIVDLAACSFRGRRLAFLRRRRRSFTQLRDRRQAGPHRKCQPRPDQAVAHQGGVGLRRCTLRDCSGGGGGARIGKNRLKYCCHRHRRLPDLSGNSGKNRPLAQDDSRLRQARRAHAALANSPHFPYLVECADTRSPRQFGPAPRRIM
jgi:hypothetical protein